MILFLAFCAALGTLLCFLGCLLFIWGVVEHLRNPEKTFEFIGVILSVITLAFLSFWKYWYNFLEKLN